MNHVLHRGAGRQAAADDSTVGLEYLHLIGTSSCFEGGAASCCSSWTVNGSRHQGRGAERHQPEAIALGVFGGIAALAALLIAGQVIARQVRRDDADRWVLQALGRGPGAPRRRRACPGCWRPSSSERSWRRGWRSPCPRSPRSVRSGRWSPAASSPSTGPSSRWRARPAPHPGAHRHGTRSRYRQAPHRAAARLAARQHGSGIARAGLGAGLAPAAVTGIRFALEPGSGRPPCRCARRWSARCSPSSSGRGHVDLRRQPPQAGVATGPVRLELGLRPDSPTGRGRSRSQSDHPAARRDGYRRLHRRLPGVTVQMDGQSVPPVIVADPARRSLQRSCRATLSTARMRSWSDRSPSLPSTSISATRSRAARPGDARGCGSSARRRCPPSPRGGDPSAMGHGRRRRHRAPPASRRNPVNDPSDRAERHPRASARRCRAAPRPAAAAADRLGTPAHTPQIVANFGPVALELAANVLPVQRPAEIVNYRSMGTTPALLGGVAGSAPRSPRSASPW